MAKGALTRTQSNKLLNTLLDNPELPTFVRRLNPPTLNRLIEHVGLEDAGPLISLTTDRQLRGILDESLWANLTPGKPETHRPEAFIRWLDVLVEQGDTFVAERLHGLGADFVVLNLSRLIAVDAKDAILHSAPNAYAEEYGNYLVGALFDDEWDTTRAALTALQAEYPDFCEHVLGRCHGETEWGKRTHVTLMADTYGERRDARENAGFVTPESAGAFLGVARTAELASLIAADNLDLMSQRYFLHLGGSYLRGAEPEAAEEPAESSSTPDPAKLKELDDVLVEAAVVDDGTSMLLLSAPEQTMLPVKKAIDALQDSDPTAFGARLGELVYLSNVVISGTAINGERFTDVEAANMVLATCNLAFDYPGVDESAVGDGLVRLFRIGWHILHRLSLRAAQTLVTVLGADDVGQQMPDRAWILAEIEVSLNSLVDQVRAGRFDDVAETLSFVSLVLEREVCDALAVIVSDVPRYPLSRRPRFVESMQDLAVTAPWVMKASMASATRSGS
jgi:hypothetical protein